MKREILFRGKDFLKEEWVYGDLVKTKNFVAIKRTNGDYFHPTQVSPNTVGQYTGLKDKDGREIYEGDILQYIGKRRDNMNKVYRRKVVFHEGMFALLSKELPAYSALNYHCMEDGRSAWSVIGNIHDNPELIK
ncbi:YopX family protein [Prevotella pallens]|uniref:YopX family protein n=1 Tax=Prevotella pallens TaxID=60133 RepID=UPI002490D715|nr:YopX family protein [Prevotella pallens]